MYFDAACCAVRTDFGRSGMAGKKVPAIKKTPAPAPGFLVGVYDSGSARD
jgi:hypothetical protein